MVRLMSLDPEIENFIKEVLKNPKKQLTIKKPGEHPRNHPGNRFLKLEQVARSFKSGKTKDFLYLAKIYFNNVDENRYLN